MHNTASEVAVRPPTIFDQLINRVNRATENVRGLEVDVHRVINNIVGQPPTPPGTSGNKIAGDIARPTLFIAVDELERAIADLAAELNRVNQS